MSAGQRSAVEGVPVEMVPTTAREHITGSAALNIPHGWRLGGGWHQSWFDVKPTRVSADQITDEKRFGRLLDRLGRAGLRDARPGLALPQPPGPGLAREGLGCDARARDHRDGLGAAREDRGQGRAGGAAANRPPRLLPHPASPGPVGTGALVGVAPAERANADGARGVGGVAEGMVAMNCPAISFTAAKVRHEAYLSGGWPQHSRS